MDTLLAKLPAGGVMSFLMLSGSFWAILNISREDAKYPTALKRIVLIIAWIIAVLSLLTFFLSIYEIIIPALNSLPVIEVPVMNFNIRTLVGYSGIIIVIVIMTFISSFITRKLEKFLPKRREIVMMDELTKDLKDIVNQFLELSRESRNAAKESRDLVKDFTKQIIVIDKNLSSQPKTKNSVKGKQKNRITKKKSN